MRWFCAVHESFQPPHTFVNGGSVSAWPPGGQSWTAPILARKTGSRSKAYFIGSSLVLCVPCSVGLLQERTTILLFYFLSCLLRIMCPLQPEKRIRSNLMEPSDDFTYFLKMLNKMVRHIHLLIEGCLDSTLSPSVCLTEDASSVHLHRHLSPSNDGNQQKRTVHDCLSWKIAENKISFTIILRIIKFDIISKCVLKRVCRNFAIQSNYADGGVSKVKILSNIYVQFLKRSSIWKIELEVFEEKIYILYNMSSHTMI